MKLNKKIAILTESQVKSLMDNLRVERDMKILSEMKNQDPKGHNFCIELLLLNNLFN